MKEWQSFEQQREKLAQRGLIIKDNLKAEEWLSRVNYYYISGYLHDYKNIDEKYSEGITAAKIKRIIDFDSRLRMLLLHAVDIIEKSIKTNLAYYFAKNYQDGKVAYLIESNFPGYEEEHKKFISIFNKLKFNNRKQLFVKHHQQKYDGYMPIWAAVEIMTIGNIKFLFGLLDNNTKNDIAKVYGYGLSNFDNWLECLRIFRNSLAHSSRLFNLRISNTPNKIKEANIQTGMVFDYILMCKHLMLDKDEWNNFIFGTMESFFEENTRLVDLKCYGFPRDWKSYLYKGNYISYSNMRKRKRNLKRSNWKRRN